MRMIIGGKEPGGIHAMARSDMATTWAMAWPMSVSWKNPSSHRPTCWMFRDLMSWMPSTYWKYSSSSLTMNPSIWSGLMPMKSKKT